MLGKMARSALRPPFGLPEVPANRLHHAPTFQGAAKALLYASSGVIWGIPGYSHGPRATLPAPARTR